MAQESYGETKRMEVNPKVVKRLRMKKERRKERKCIYCSPHGGENASRKPKYGVKKAKHKNKRRA